MQDVSTPAKLQDGQNQSVRKQSENTNKSTNQTQIDDCNVSRSVENIEDDSLIKSSKNIDIPRCKRNSKIEAHKFLRTKLSLLEPEIIQSKPCKKSKKVVSSKQGDIDNELGYDTPKKRKRSFSIKTKFDNSKKVKRNFCEFDDNHNVSIGVDNSLENDNLNSLNSIDKSKGEAEKTPIKTTKTQKVAYLKLAGRDLGCDTPKKRGLPWDKIAYKNLSMTFHAWSYANGIPLDADVYGKEAVVITENHMADIVEFGEPSGINLLPSGLNSKSLYHKRFKNGCQRKERYVGDLMTGFVDGDGRHRKSSCPHYHCSSLKSWIQYNNISPIKKSGTFNKLANSPNSPTEIKRVVRKLQRENRDLKRDLSLGARRSRLFSDKLKGKQTGLSFSEKNTDIISNIKCPFCSTIFSRRDSVVKHIRGFHPEKENDDYDLPELKILCVKCGKGISKSYRKHKCKMAVTGEAGEVRQLGHKLTRLPKEKQRVRSGQKARQQLKEKFCEIRSEGDKTTKGVTVDVPIKTVKEAATEIRSEDEIPAERECELFLCNKITIGEAGGDKTAKGGAGSVVRHKCREKAVAGEAGEVRHLSNTLTSLKEKQRVKLGQKATQQLKEKRCEIMSQGDKVSTGGAESTVISEGEKAAKKGVLEVMFQGAKTAIGEAGDLRCQGDKAEKGDVGDACSQLDNAAEGERESEVWCESDKTEDSKSKAEFDIIDVEEAETVISLEGDKTALGINISRDDSLINIEEYRAKDNMSEGGDSLQIIHYGTLTLNISSESEEMFETSGWEEMIGIKADHENEIESGVAEDTLVIIEGNSETDEKRVVEINKELLLTQQNEDDPAEEKRSEEPGGKSVTAIKTRFLRGGIKKLQSVVLTICKKPQLMILDLNEKNGIQEEVYVDELSRNKVTANIKAVINTESVSKCPVEPVSREDSGVEGSSELVNSEVALNRVSDDKIGLLKMTGKVKDKDEVKNMNLILTWIQNMEEKFDKQLVMEEQNSKDNGIIVMLMEEYANKDPTTAGKEKSTMNNYILKMKQAAFPWLKNR